MRGLLAAITSRIPTLDCCPHPDMGDDPDTAYLSPDTTHADYRGSVTNG